MKNIIPFAIILGLIGGAAAILLKPSKTQPIQQEKEQVMSPSPASSPTMKFDKAEEVLEKGKSYTATLLTEAGDIVLELFADKTPNTVNNFVFLSQKGFYDGVIFHRTIPGFMIQGGDPTGTGMGGPGYKFADEKFTGEYTRGVVAMANAGPNTNGSQFFIMHQDYALPKNYIIFGQVTKGIEVVDKIATAETKEIGEGSSPVKPIKINSVMIKSE